MPQNFLGIHGVTGFVVAVGEHGKILHFTGDTYEAQQVDSHTDRDLSAVWVESEHSGWAVGDRGTVLRWNGQQWNPITMAGKHDELLAVWSSPEDGVWIGGRGTLLNYHPGNGSGGTLLRTDNTVVAIWGSGPEDIWFLCAGRLVLHWNGTTCVPQELPGDEDDEYYALSGCSSDEPLWIGGVGGVLLRGDGAGWQEVDSGTEATIAGICAVGPDDVWVTTTAGQLRHWDGRLWRPVAFSAFGWLDGVCTVDNTIWCAGEKGVVLQHRPDDGGSKE